MMSNFAPLSFFLHNVIAGYFTPPHRLPRCKMSRHDHNFTAFGASDGPDSVQYLQINETLRCDASVMQVFLFSNSTDFRRRVNVNLTNLI